MTRHIAGMLISSDFLIEALHLPTDTQIMGIGAQRIDGEVVTVINMLIEQPELPECNAGEMPKIVTCEIIHREPVEFSKWIVLEDKHD